MINFDFDKYCYGCSTCKTICPTGAISMQYNQEGFLVPKIDLNKCIQCGACEKKCIYLNLQNNQHVIENKDVFAVFAKNEKERIRSASGGIFYKISEWMIKHDGYVCGSIWNEKWEATHIVTNNMEDIIKMQGSKYVESNLNDCYQQIMKTIKDGKKVLFSGTPCQVAGIKSLVGENPNLFTCSIICEGVPSTKVWKKYVKNLEKKQNSKLQYVNFKYKGKAGWLHPNSRYIFENNKKIEKIAYEEDLYVLGFVKNLFNRNSCHNCQYKAHNSKADIIIGDLWGTNYDLLKKSKNKGLSVLIKTDSKFDVILEDLKEDIFLKKISIMDIMNSNYTLMNCAKQNENRENFFRDLDMKNIDDNISNYVQYNKKKIKIKNILMYIGIYPKLINLKYKFRENKK